jgi:hypothetical protein
MRRLYNMNITYESLFPGLDGLARSMNVGRATCGRMGQRTAGAGLERPALLSLLLMGA